MTIRPASVELKSIGSPLARSIGDDQGVAGTAEDEDRLASDLTRATTRLADRLLIDTRGVVLLDVAGLRVHHVHLSARTHGDEPDLAELVVGVTLDGTDAQVLLQRPPLFGQPESLVGVLDDLHAGTVDDGAGPLWFLSARSDQECRGNGG